MKQVFRIIWITLLTAALVVGAALLLCGWLAPLIDSIVADSNVSVKQDSAVLATPGNERKVIILDAGHGGEDPGAIGTDGVYEKDLNLALTLKIRDLLIFEGYQVVLTRSDDRLLYDPTLNLSHKVQDLKNRLDVSTNYPNGIFVSIHMNKFPDERCSGLQVYYSGNHEQSKLLADAIQKATVEWLAPDNHRECKKATSAIFILDRITIPAVLVECGFLSNPTETGLLQDAVYQKKLAAVIAFSLDEVPGLKTQ